MKKNILLVIIIELLIFSCLCITDVSYASDFDFARFEAEGNTEPVYVPPTPSDDPGTPPSPSDDPVIVDTPVEPSINIVVQTSVQGTVFEDLEKLEKETNDDSMAGTKHLTNNYRQDSDEPGIKGVTVSFNGTDILTDSNGRYSYRNPGTYNVVFNFGKNVNLDDYRLNHDTLKYNGQDYNIVVAGNGNWGYEKNYLRKIREIQKSYTEVYIVIDYSASMRYLYDGEHARIDIVKNSAINFVEKLFEKTEGNLAVGYIAFAYDAVIVKKPTDVKTDVIDAIRNFTVEEGIGKYSGVIAPSFSQLNNKVGTNIGGAVTKAKNNFLLEETNKVIVLFSDGAATGHEGAPSLYESDTDAEIEYKLNQVAELTKLDLQAVVDSGITLISILNKTEGTEKEYVEKSFKDGDSWRGSYYEVDYENEDAVNEALLNDTMEIIERTESEFVEYRETKEFNGDDDLERRLQVNENYKVLYYDKLTIFELIKKLDGKKINDVNAVARFLESNVYSFNRKKEVYRNFISDPDTVGKFIENSWMKSTPNSITLYGINTGSDGKISSITDGTGIAYSFEYYTDDDGIEWCIVTDNCGTGVGGEYKASNVHVQEIAIILDAALIKRDEFKLELDKKITGVRVTLVDGTVLYNWLSSNAYQTVDKNNEFKKVYCKQLQKKAGLIDEVDMTVRKLPIEEISNLSDGLFLIMDLEILQGATLEVEYTLIVKNNSRNSTFSKEFAIADYFDTGLVYRASNELLTEDGTNADYGWVALDKRIMDEMPYFSKDAKNYANNQFLYISYDQESYNYVENVPSDGNISDFKANSKYINPVIGNNGERYVKVVLSKVLAPESVDDFIYRNQGEIIEYSDNNSRRMNWTHVDDDETVIYEYPISGNYVPTTYNEYFAPEFTHIDEVDSVMSNRLQIIPPTGVEIVDINKNKKIYLICGATTLITYFCVRKLINKKLGIKKK